MGTRAERHCGSCTSAQAVAFRRSLYRFCTPHSWLDDAVDLTRATGQISQSLLEHNDKAARDIRSIVSDQASLTLMDKPASVTVELELLLNWEHDYELTEDADMVYALWLRLLSKGPDWNNITSEAQEKVSRRLYEEVQTASVNIKSLWDSLFATQGSKEYTPAYGVSGSTWVPSPELFKDVGFEPREPDMVPDGLQRFTELHEAWERMGSLPLNLPQLGMDRRKKKTTRREE